MIINFNTLCITSILFRRPRTTESISPFRESFCCPRAVLHTCAVCILSEFFSSAHTSQIKYDIKLMLNVIYKFHITEVYGLSKFMLILYMNIKLIKI